jgi:hypothetical protein
MATIASLIIDIGANVSGLQRDVSQVNSTLDTMTGTAGKLAGALGATFSVAAVVAYAREIISFASDMADASAKTGIAVEEVQAFNYALAGSGVTVDQFSSAIAQLSKRLVEGDGGAVGALRKLGLTVQDIIAMDPGEAFLTISERVSAIENPMRQSAIAMELFGRSGANLLPAMKDDLRALMQQAKDTGAVMSEDLIESADAFDDAFSRATIGAKAWTAQLVQATASAFMAIDPMQQLIGLLEDAGALAGFTGNMSKVVEQLDKGHEGAKAFVRDGIEPLTISLEQAKKIERDLEDQMKKSTKAREENTRAVEQAQRAADNWARMVYDHEIAAILKSQEVLEENTKAQKERTDAAMEMMAANEANIQHWAQVQEEEHLKAARASEAWERAVHDDMARNEHAMIESATTLRDVWDSLGESMADRIHTTMSIIGDELGPRFKKIVSGLADTWANGRNLMKGIGEMMTGDFSSVISTIQAGIALVRAAWFAMKGLFSQEVEHANDTRDNFILSNWSGGGAELAALLTSLGAGEGGGSLYHDLIGASDVAGVNAAKAAIERFLHDNNVPGFMAGTFGMRNFGAGTLAVLHGEEEVRTKSQAQAEGSLSARVDAMAMTLQALVRDLPNQLQAAGSISRGRGLSRA